MRSFKVRLIAAKELLDTVRDRPFIDRLSQQSTLIYESVEAELQEAMVSGALDQRDSASETSTALR